MRNPRLEMEKLDQALQATEDSLIEEKTITIYKNKLDRSNLKYNLVVTLACFAFFFLSTGHIGFALFITAIIASTCLQWREVDREIKYKPDK